MKFTDPTGNWAHIVIGAVIGGAVNLYQHWDKIDNLGDGLLAFGIGAGAGALGAATGGYAAAALKLGTTGAISGAVTGFFGGGIGSAVKQVGNVIAFGGDKYGDKFSFGEVGLEAVGGGLFGGVIGGGVALFKGQNFWWGNTPASTRIAAGLFKETWGQGFRTEATEYAKNTADVLKPSIEELGDLSSAFSRYSTETLVVTASRNLTYIPNYANAAKGFAFRSFDAFKKAYGGAGRGNAWHHIVEQYEANSIRFGVERIQNVNNLIHLDDAAGGIHRQITGHYNSIQSFTGGQTVRAWLSTQSFEAQLQYGLQKLSDYGWRP